MSDKKTNEVSTVNIEEFLAQEEARQADDLARLKERKKSSNQLKIKIIISVVCICLSAILSSSYAIGSQYSREKGRRYKEAQMLQDKGMYQDAIDVYEKLYGYKDSNANITECKKDMEIAKEKLTYETAVKSYNNKDYLTAANFFNKVKDYQDAKEKAKESYYKYGQELVTKADYANAYIAFTNASDYSNAKLLAAKYKAAYAGVGSTITLGKYDQDGDASDGPEGIEWYIISKSDTQAILLSKYALILMPYNENGEAVPYADSTIRTYVNETFYNTAFTAEEKSYIVPTKINENGKESENNVFILTNDMFNKYVSTSSIMRVAKASEAAKPNSTYSGRTTFWWTSSTTNNRVVCIGTSGSVYDAGATLSYGVRPAIVIDFTK